MKTKILLIIAVLFSSISVGAQQVYVLNSRSQLEPAVRAVSVGTKVSGASLLAAYGAKLTTSMVIDGKNARLNLPQAATYFYIISPVHIPIESWKMSKLKTKKKTRLLPYMKTGAYSGSETKLDEIQLRVEQLSDEVYKIIPSEYLEKGEYALFRVESGVPAEVYDFRIDPSLPSSLNVPNNSDVVALLNSKNPVKNETAAPQMANNTNSDKVVGSRQLTSDVDINIPNSKKEAENTIVLIIANEKYDDDIKDVDFALNDGETFEQYMKLAIGVPSHQIIVAKDATFTAMKRAFNNLKKGAGLIGPNSKVIVYYAGHGYPDEATKEAYILPTDHQKGDMSTAFKLKDIYSDLGAIKAQSVVFFIDGCFSGAVRSDSEDMILSARSVSIKPKEEKPVGNLVVFSAAQGNQTALPYKEKSHGLMTYFLLKKLQESEGNATLGELEEYIVKNVEKNAYFINSKEQQPTVTADKNNKIWRKMTLR